MNPKVSDMFHIHYPTDKDCRYRLLHRKQYELDRITSKLKKDIIREALKKQLQD